MAAASVFLGGETNFIKPLDEAVKLLYQENYRGADIVFITDGEANLPEDDLKKFLDAKAKGKTRYTVYCLTGEMDL